MTSFQLSHGTYGAFNHERARDAEEEYDRLRNLARQEEVFAALYQEWEAYWSYPTAHGKYCD